MNISREDLFFIHALEHPRDDEWRQMAIQLCTPTLNWSRLFQRADAMGLGPLLYRQLSGVKAQLKIPDDRQLHVVPRVTGAGSKRRLYRQPSDDSRCT